MIPTWVVQSNLPNSDTLQLLHCACDKIGLPIQAVAVAPRQSSLPVDLPCAPLIVHGATTLVRLAVGDDRFRHGVFYSSDNFCHSAYQREFGLAYLNHDAEIVTWSQAFSSLSTRPGLFVKPPDDLKAFTGFVASEMTLRELLEKLSRRPEILPKQVVIGARREVDAEWRLFVVGQEIVSGSMYRPSADSYIPAALLEFASHAIREWQPAPVFVLDVGRVDAQWKIIECNCFNWSRFYNSDVTSIVKAVSDYQSKKLTAAN